MVLSKADFEKRSGGKPTRDIEIADYGSIRVRMVAAFVFQPIALEFSRVAEPAMDEEKKNLNIKDLGPEGLKQLLKLSCDLIAESVIDEQGSLVFAGEEGRRLLEEQDSDFLMPAFLGIMAFNQPAKNLGDIERDDDGKPVLDDQGNATAKNSVTTPSLSSS